jgi:hypothetical protein
VTDQQQPGDHPEDEKCGVHGMPPLRSMHHSLAARDIADQSSVRWRIVNPDNAATGDVQLLQR